jgi:hypothetical protein
MPKVDDSILYIKKIEQSDTLTLGTLNPGPELDINTHKLF